MDLSIRKNKRSEGAPEGPEGNQWRLMEFPPGRAPEGPSQVQQPTRTRAREGTGAIMAKYCSAIMAKYSSAIMAKYCSAIITWINGNLVNEPN